MHRTLCYLTAVAMTLAGAQSTALAADVQITITDDARKLADLPAVKTKSTSEAASGATFSIDSNKKFQSILGFGGAMTDATCYVFNQLSPDARRKLFENLFSKTHLNLSVNRIPMGASDYSTHVYSYDDSDTPDPELAKFNVDHDKKYILPMLREAMAVNPDIYFFGSPWSPPGWMKSNKTMLGGNMQRKYMPQYAQYFLKFVEAYKSNGIPISAVTVNNEVDTDQDSKMPACLWPQEYEVDFVRNNLGPVFEKAGLKTQIWMIDHNYNLWGRALSSLEEKDLKKYASAIAWHGYVGDINKLNVVHDAHPEVGMHWTEGGPNFDDPNYAKDWTTWSNSFTQILKHWCSSITVWNLALDEAGKPNLGPFPCGGLVTIDSKTGAITQSGQYYALAQFSKFVQPGAVRIEGTTSGERANGIDGVAFMNPDKSVVAVLTNSGVEPHNVAVRLQGEAAEVELPPNSIATLRW